MESYHQEFMETFSGERFEPEEPEECEEDEEQVPRSTGGAGYTAKEAANPLSPPPTPAITWDALIVDAEGQIKASQATIRKLKRSIRFFREQKGDGKLFPKIEG